MTQVTKDYKETHTLQGKVMWAKVQRPNEDNKYTVDMDLDKDGIKLITSLGIPVKTDKNDAKRKFVTFTRYATDMEGNIKPMKIVDAKLNPFDRLIGNGSLCKVEFFDKDWTYGRKSGTSAYMTGIQVLDLVPYEPKPRGKLQVEEDFEPASETNRFSSEDSEDEAPF